MSYKYEKELINKAGEYMEFLEKNGYRTRISMIRDYMIKLEIIKEENDCGNAVIYYKPSKDSFSLKTHEILDEDIKNEIQYIWDNEFTLSAKTKSDEYKIYVDGSYIDGSIGYGFVVIKNNEIIKEEAGSVEDPLYVKSHQVGGEIKAVEKAVNWAEKKGINKVNIYYDLANLEKWITGEYKARNPMTQEYRNKIKESSIKITWQKVESHTGDRWNEYADKLAKKGAGG